VKRIAKKSQTYDGQDRRRERKARRRPAEHVVPRADSTVKESDMTPFGRGSPRSARAQADRPPVDAYAVNATAACRGDFGEGLEPRQPTEQIDAGDEWQEPRHPEFHQGRCSRTARLRTANLNQSPAVDQIARCGKKNPSAIVRLRGENWTGCSEPAKKTIRLLVPDWTSRFLD